MKDEIAKEIVDELRLIREELQNLTMAVRSKASNSENAYGGKSRKSYQARPPYPRDPGHSGVKPHRNIRPGEPRSQWHQNFPKDKQIIQARRRVNRTRCRAKSTCPVSAFGRSRPAADASREANGAVVACWLR